MNKNDVMYVEPGDDVFYLKCVKGLPFLQGFSGNGLDKYGKPIPYGVGSHSVRAIRKACQTFNPISILEIGFNMGYSSALWLNLSDAIVTGVDISDKDETMEAARLLGEQFPSRFSFILSNSKFAYEKVSNKQYDMIFIDGDHLEDGVMADIRLGLKLGIKKFVFDDWLPQYGPGVQPAISKNPIRITEVIGNIALGEVK